jgi:hypothetical protein
MRHAGCATRVETALEHIDGFGPLALAQVEKADAAVDDDLIIGHVVRGEALERVFSIR